MKTKFETKKSTKRNPIISKHMRNSIILGVVVAILVSFFGAIDLSSHLDRPFDMMFVYLVFFMLGLHAGLACSAIWFLAFGKHKLKTKNK